MGQLRQCQVISNIELSFYEALAQAATDSKESLSSYVRRLIITDLERTGLITKDKIREVVLGKDSLETLLNL